MLGLLSIHFIVNVFFMMLFFGIAAAKTTQSCLPGSDVHPLRKTIIAIIGGRLMKVRRLP